MKKLWIALLALTLSLAVSSAPAVAAPLSAQTALLNFASTSVGTLTYQTMFASLPKSIKALWVSNTGAQLVNVAIGGVGSEVIQIAVPANSTSSPPVLYPLVVSQNQRISVVSSAGTNSSGTLIMNAFFN